MTRKCETFTEKVDNKDVVFKVYEPDVVTYKIATKARNEAFIEALTSKAPLRAQINTILRTRGQWDDEREDQYNKLSKELLEKEKKLKTGGIRLSKARELALEMSDVRAKLRELLTDKSVLDGMTAEGQSDNAHFNALLVECLVYNDENGQEQKYFKDLDEYLVKGGSNVSNTAAQKLAEMLYTLGTNVERSLPENQFLLKYKFVDEKLRYINKDGRLTDREGRLIDENGRYIGAQGGFVDKFGSPINDKGDYVVEVQPFLDDDDKPIVEEAVS